jgi:cation diffusion facilitator family transporter
MPGRNKSAGTPNAAERQKQRIAIVSVLASGSLASLKFVVGFLTGSLGLIAEAAHSLLDLVSTLITLAVIRIAALPPDRDHPYGHEKAENLGALAGMTLLALTAAGILYNAAKTILRPEAPKITVWSFLVLLASLVVDFARTRRLRSAAAQYKSDALRSDAEHFGNDMLASLSVLIGLTVVAVAPLLRIPEAISSRADALAAICVALIALTSVWQLGVRAIRALMDNIPGELTDRLTMQVEKIDGVVKGSTHLRSRFVGNRPYVEVKLAIPRGGSLESAHRLSEQVEQAVQSELANAQATVHVEPVAIPNESPAASVRAVADRLGLRVHNLNVYQTGSELRVELDLELAEDLTLREAHQHSEELERSLAVELPENTVITVHLEPRSDNPRPAVKQPKIREEMAHALAHDLKANDTRLHDVLVTDEGLVVTVKKPFPGDTSLRQVHEAMTELERQIEELNPEVVRVHVDPEILDLKRGSNH